MLTKIVLDEVSFAKCASGEDLDCIRSASIGLYDCHYLFIEEREKNPIFSRLEPSLLGYFSDTSSHAQLIFNIISLLDNYNVLHY